MLEAALVIATLLGGMTAIWFIADKFREEPIEPTRAISDVAKAQCVEYNERGRDLVREFATAPDWSWHLLSRALSDYRTAISSDPSNPHPVINKAYVFHLCGRRDLAERCLGDARALVDQPGKHHRSVENAIREGRVLTGAPLAAPPPPDWFVEQHLAD